MTTKPTHRCKVCGALWRLWTREENEASGLAKMSGFEDGSWSLIGEKCGECCDNVAMEDQIEELPDGSPTPEA